MSEELAKEIKELKELMQDSKSPDGKTMGWLKMGVAALIFVAGLGVTWGLTRGEASAMSSNLGKLETQNKIEHVTIQTDLNVNTKNIVDIQILQATNSQILQQLGKDISEIQKDIKKMAKEHK